MAPSTASPALEAGWEIPGRPGGAPAWLARYAALGALGFLALSRVDTAALCEALARAAHGVLVLLGMDVVREAALLRGPGFSMLVTPVCDGTDVCLLLGAAVLATAAPWRRRLAGLALALLLTQLVNVARIAALFVVGTHLPAHFEVAHQILWQVAMMLFAVLFYVRWR